jgi:hypothetical protein
MSTTATVVVIVVVLVVIAVVAALVMRRGGGAAGMGSGMRLKRRFGPEYDRTLQRHDGDEKATRHELGERVKRYGDLELRPVTGQGRERYNNRWAELQARFVDEPGRAVSGADRLLADLAAERGFPGAESPEHFDALSVHHPYQVQGYRQTHALAEHGGSTGTGVHATEDLRQAMLSARSLFTELIENGGGADESPQGDKELTTRPVTPQESADNERDAEDERATGRVPAQADEPAAPARPVRAPDAAESDDPDEPVEPAASDGRDASGSERHRPLGDRLAGLTGSRRNHHPDEDR